MSKVSSMEFIESVLKIAHPDKLQNPIIRKALAWVFTLALKSVWARVKAAAQAFWVLAKDPSIENIIAMNDALYGNIKITWIENIPKDYWFTAALPHPTGPMDWVVPFSTIVKTLWHEKPVKVLAKSIIQWIDIVLSIKTEAKKGEKIDSDRLLKEQERITVQEKGAVIICPAWSVAQLNDQNIIEEQRHNRGYYKRSIELETAILPMRYENAYGKKEHYEDFKRRWILKKIYRGRGILNLALADYSETTLHILEPIKPDLLKRVHEKFNWDASLATQHLQKFIMGEISTLL